MSFEYRDKDGENEPNAEASIRVDKQSGVVHVGVYSGDMDGDRYDIYVPNHREALFALASEIFEVLELTKDWDDGFSFNFCHAEDSGSAKKNEGTVLYDEPGIVNWYG